MCYNDKQLFFIMEVILRFDFFYILGWFHIHEQPPDTFLLKFKIKNEIKENSVTEK